jgi:hypothetical protein
MSTQAIYQYVVLAKSAKGKQAASVISQAIASSNCFVFSELLNLPSIQAVYFFLILKLLLAQRFR